MDRKTWLEIRNNGQIPIQIYHEYYKEKGGEMEWEEFCPLFQLYCRQYDPSSKMIKEYDNRFNILLVCSQEGDFLIYN